MDDNDSTSAKRSGPAEQSGNTLPILPLALGAAALLFGVVLFAIVWGSSQSTRHYVPPSPIRDAGKP